MALIHRLSLTITGCHSHNYIWWNVINIFYLNCSNQITVPTAYHRGIPVLRVHYWASRHLLGFVDLDLGSSPGWWAATVATYCPSRPGNYPNLFLRNLANDGPPNSVLPHGDRPRCYCLTNQFFTVSNLTISNISIPMSVTGEKSLILGNCTGWQKY